MVEFKLLEKYVKHGTPIYRVGSDGSIWSRQKKVGNRWVLTATTDWQLMKPAVHHDGYRYVTLYLHGKSQSRKVSVLVCEAFHGEKPSKGLEACHDNGTRTDDAASNLYWGTRKKNAEDRERHGNTARGEKNGYAKLTDAQADELLSLRGTMSQEAAGKRFGLSQVHVGRIWNGKRNQT